MSGRKGRGGPIESLGNLGPRSVAWLREAGVTTIDELRELGPVVAYRLVRQRQASAGLNLLWALDAGLRGIDWRRLTADDKNRLRDELDRL